MKIEIFDDTVDYVTRNKVYKFCTKSIFKLGWEDTQELERYTKNLHSKWSLQDLKNCGLFPYIKNCFSKSKNFKFDEKKISIIELNLVRQAWKPFAKIELHALGLKKIINQGQRRHDTRED